MAEEKAPEFRFISDSPEDTKALGRAIGERCRGGEVILLSGELGAGKTTFVQGLARGLGIEGPVQSPSFVLERIHRGRLVLRHLDLYRLSAEEVEDSGLLADLKESDVTVVEWAQRAPEAADAALRVEIQVDAGKPFRRIIHVKALSSEWQTYLYGMKSC